LAVLSFSRPLSHSRGESAGRDYSGPEEVVVVANIHPSAHMNIEKLTRAMDDLDHKIRLALPFVADVFIDITANRTE
jgi:hypothetical protein